MPPDWQLVLAGSLGYRAGEVLERIEVSPRRTDIRVPGYVAQSELERLYGEARIFAFPSLDEGFGMPVLDAMARGVPVVTSAGSALREVAGDSALLVEPADTTAIAAALNCLARDESLRSDLRNKGLLRAAGFTWTSAVDKTWAVYQELL
jgi:glycosyltransferase involved in cell wall biosynthesis